MVDRWTLTLAGLLGKPWPSLPVLPGRIHVLVGDDEPDGLPAWALLPAAEIARREGISLHMAHVRIKKARQQAAQAAPDL